MGMKPINLHHNGDRKKRRALRDAAKALAYSERNARHETQEQTEARREEFKRTPEILAIAAMLAEGATR